ncbi:MAG: hypothetical protein ABL882_08740 [Sphingopyxis sp.]
MTDLSLSLMSSAIALVALTIISLAALRGWSQLMALRRHEIDTRPATPSSDTSIHHDDALPSHTGSRIELADLRERVRKLEAIAAGVDL